MKAYGPSPPDGVALLVQARALYEQLPASALRTESIANTYLEAAIGERGADIAAARADFHHAIALFRELDGPDSTDEAKCWYDLGETYRERGEYRDAEIGYANARRIYEERVGPSGRCRRDDHAARHDPHRAAALRRGADPVENRCSRSTPITHPRSA